MEKRDSGGEFSPEFKLEAVRLATSGEKSLRQVARKIGVHENLLRSWKTQALARSGGGGSTDVFPGNGKLVSVDEELRRLRRELSVTRQERDFLKKATVSSTGHRNATYKLHQRRGITKGFFWSRVQPLCDGIEVWYNRERRHSSRCWREFSPLGTLK